MSRSTGRVLLLVFACAVFLFLLEGLLSPNPRERNYEVFTEMVYSLAAESQGQSACLPGGMTEQAVVPGVVVRGQLPFRYGPGPEEAQRAGRELANPYADDDSVLERGARIYSVFCALCHAGDGGGQGSVVQRGVLPPPSLLAARAQGMSDGEMFHVLTRGQGLMASYAAQVSADDRWKVIRHVRSMQEAAR